jgi:hypothetical protein
MDIFSSAVENPGSLPKWTADNVSIKKLKQMSVLYDAVLATEEFPVGNVGEGVSRRIT